MERNKLVDVLRLFFAFMVVDYHWGLGHETKLCYYGGYIAVDFFFILTGYLIMQSINRINNQCSVGYNTWEILRKKFRRIYLYVLFMGVFYIFYSGKGMAIYEVIGRAIFDFSLLGMTGFSISPLFVTWFVSAQFLALLLIIPLAIHYKDSFSKIIAPISAILIYGWIAQNVGYIRGSESEYYLIARLGLIRAVADICFGSFVYEVTAAQKKIRTRISIWGGSLAVLVTMIIISYNTIYHPCSLYDFVSIYLCGVIIVLAFSGKEIFSRFIPSVISTFCSNLSVSVFFCQGIVFYFLRCFDISSRIMNYASIVVFGVIAFVVINRLNKLIIK